MRESRQPKNTVLKHKNIISGIGLFGLALGCAAATLGRAQGSVWIGSPLELSVQVQLTEGEDTSSACVDAEVFHADTRQDTNRIRVTVEPGAHAHVGVVRIVSSALVDEPVVTVYLRAGCLQKSSRRYVLLAELPNDVATPTPVPNASRLATLPLAARTHVPAPGAPVATTASPSGQSSPRLERKARPVDDQERKQAPKPDKVAYKTPEPVQTSNRVAPAANVRLARASGRSRLKLDLLDLVEEKEVTLKSSTELSILPTDNLQRRSEAAALWRALNASPEDILREAARIQVMGTEVDALKTLTAKNQQGLAELGAQLQKAEAERYSNWLVYVLVALLAAVMLALALLWRRRVIPDKQVQWHVAPDVAPASDELDIDLDIPAMQAPAKPNP